VLEAHCEYKRPARYDEEIEVRTEGRMVSPVRMKFSYTVVRRADQVVAAEGYTLHAAVDVTGRPCRLPARVKEVFA
jgi:acyl-CoA thioester hydrolase